MNRKILYTVCAVLVCVVFALLVRWHYETKDGNVINVDGNPIRVDIALTEAQRQRGLSGRSSLGKGSGMLFVFPTDGRHAFWMKDMRFSIDILWIAADGRIVYLLEDLATSTYPQSFAPDTDARYVLEVPAGYVDAKGIEVGDIVEL